MINKNTKIGFIGTGVMGRGMIQNLLKGGYSVYIYNRTKEKALPLIEKGAILKNSIKELCKECGVVITMVGYPSDVEEVYLNEEGILNNIKPKSYVVDMTTSKPSLAKKIYSKAKENDIFSLDAPVSGGDIGAAEGTLSIMVGGDKEAFDALMPIFELMGKNIVLQGTAGSGQHTKMCNQIAIASNIMGVCEALSYAKKSGLDPKTVLKSIGAGGAASWQLSAYAPRILKGDYAPGFYIKHFVKDMKIALEEASEMGLTTPALELSKKLYDKLIADGQEDLGTQALYNLYK
ncbi:NAD(P)-dependent oxidoreductase [Clostridium felsineum]|uniref:2-hydroxy-3-oxopropionate reductase n=1 Tax=Clostridium felsineum TaxID=36839 RepID=A0A1S8LQQ0_9CLOT|nr:NAD(P)-dependent oxidoreductase [Clostridium felsineum]URZ08479.1 2-hydroxy-3-oxopropionate reductase [Clostridium felsineum]URZ13510.1 2-hydroxy-3-oxopropionate reductase [Clostridium felsineum]